jgi:HEAT repeat protein
MSIAVLNEVYSEVRRLAIAGSVVAPGDFRLKKLVEPLKKAGAKAPVFAKVADSVEEVINSTDATSATSLLNLSSLVCSILYTQGSTGVEGKLETIQSSSVQAKRTQTSARMLKPLIEALTTTGSGRLEQIRGAVELGLFSDLRLVRPALNAIDDVYAEIADLIAEKVLPQYGKAILGELQSTFDGKGKGGHARRLKLMHQIDPEFARDLVKESLSTGSPDVKIAAIECLGDSPDDLNYLIEQSKAKAKDVRQAAYHSLCKLSHADAIQVLTTAMDGKDLGILAKAVSQCKPTKLIEIALDRAKNLFVEIPAVKDKKKQGEAVARLLDLLTIIRNEISPAVATFLQQCIEATTSLEKVKSTPSGLDIVESAVEALAEAGEAGIKFIIEQRDKVHDGCFATVFDAAFESLSPKDFYKTFSPYMNRSAKKNSPAYHKFEMVRAGLMDDFGFHYRWMSNEPKKPVDIAWLNDAIAADDLELVLSLAQPKHAGTIKYIDSKLANPKALAKVDWDIASAMLTIGHPKATEYIIENLTARLKKKSSYESYSWCYLAARLSPDALPALEALAGDPKLSDHAGDRLIDAINEIRERAKK